MKKKRRTTRTVSTAMNMMMKWETSWIWIWMITNSYSHLVLNDQNPSRLGLDQCWTLKSSHLLKGYQLRKMILKNPVSKWHLLQTKSLKETGLKFTESGNNGTDSTSKQVAPLRIEIWLHLSVHHCIQFYSLQRKMTFQIHLQLESFSASNGNEPPSDCLP